MQESLYLNCEPCALAIVISYVMCPDKVLHNCICLWLRHLTSLLNFDHFNDVHEVASARSRSSLSSESAASVMRDASYSNTDLSRVLCHQYEISTGCD